METELNRMVATSTIIPVDFSELVSLIVPVFGIVNPVLQIDMHPIPNIDDLYSQVSGTLSYETGFKWRLLTGSSRQRVTETNDDKYS